MKSLLLTPELFSGEGGIMRMLRLYLKALCDLSGDRDSVRFVSLNDGHVGLTELRSYANGRLVEWKACNRSKTRFSIAALRMGLASDRIVCGHIGQLPVAWTVSVLRPQLPYYLVAHGIEVWRPFSSLEHRALKGARCIFCVSDYTRRQLLQHCPLLPEQTAILPNALDPQFDPDSPGTAANDSKVILSISRLSTADNYKGIEHLIAAMPAVCAAVPGARLRIVGRGDGTAGLQSLAQRLNVGGTVEFAGFIGNSELHGEFERCRLFALPSEKEGFGIVYLEAMANGRPCLGARSGGVPEVITADTGVLVDYGDVPGIASAIVAAFQREWRLEPLLERARAFSYSRFKMRLDSLLVE